MFDVIYMAKKLQERKEVHETLRLQKEINNSTSNGLPHEHLINTPEKDLMAMVFTANTGERLVFEEGEPDPEIPHYYWRSVTYDLYNGRSWNTSPVTSASYAADQSLFEFSGERNRVIHQTIKKT